MDAREEQARAAEAVREQQHAEESSPSDPNEKYDWYSWNQFFGLIHGSEYVGYEVDEVGWPLDGEPWGGVEGRR